MVKAAERKTMGRPKGSGKKSERDDVAVKVDRLIVSKARLIAGDRGISLAELLSGMLAGPVEREYGKLVRKTGGHE